MNKKYRSTLIFLFTFLSFGIFYTEIQGQTSSTVIDSTVKLSVCGDSMIEGLEDCEGTDLHSETCATLGYREGALSCTIACSFDVSLCISHTPLPTIAPVVITESQTVTATQAVSVIQSLQQASNNIIPALLNFISVPKRFENSIQTPVVDSGDLPPPVAKLVAAAGQEKITTENMPVVLKLWVDKWKNNVDTSDASCDVTGDNICEVKDFSVLMYYVEK